MKMTRLLHQQHSDTEFAQYVPPPHTHTHCVWCAVSSVSPGVSGCLRVRGAPSVGRRVRLSARWRFPTQ